MSSRTPSPASVTKGLAAKKKKCQLVCQIQLFPSEKGSELLFAEGYIYFLMCHLFLLLFFFLIPASCLLGVWPL